MKKHPNGDRTLLPGTRAVKTEKAGNFRRTSIQPAVKPKPAPVAAAEGEPGIPVFNEDQVDELTYFLETGFTTVPRIKFPPRYAPFVKDGVLVDPQADFVNGSVGYKSTGCGCLYRATNVSDGYWFSVQVRPEHIVWLKAWPDWTKRQRRRDWSAQDTDRPEVAPWLGKEAA